MYWFYNSLRDQRPQFFSYKAQMVSKEAEWSTLQKVREFFFEFWNLKTKLSTSRSWKFLLKNVFFLQKRNNSKTQKKREKLSLLL